MTCRGVSAAQLPTCVDVPVNDNPFWDTTSEPESAQTKTRLPFTSVLSNSSVKLHSPEMFTGVPVTVRVVDTLMFSTVA